MALVPLHFDTELFGRRIAKVDLPTDVHGVPQQLTSLPFQDYNIVQIKVAAQDVATIDKLNASDFKFCEGEIDFDMEVPPGFVASMPPFKPLRHSKENDIPVLSELAALSFRGRTRFRSPWYSDAEADLMYSTWITKAVRGEFDDTCLVVDDSAGRIIGFVSLRAVNGKDVRIGLIAVREDEKRRGLGRYLVEAAKEYTGAQGRSRLLAATQTSNLPAMKLYSSLGGVPSGTSYWFYRM